MRPLLDRLILLLQSALDLSQDFAQILPHGLGLIGQLSEVPLNPRQFGKDPQHS